MCDKARMSLKKAKWVLFNAECARRFGSHKRLEIRYYFCNLCNSYHVTSKKFNYDNKDRIKTKSTNSC